MNIQIYLDYSKFQFFSAGFESASTTMTFCLYELALNCTIQEHLRKEIIKALQLNDNKITYEVVMELKYLQMVIEGKL